MAVIEQEKARIVSSAIAGVELLTSITVAAEGAAQGRTVVSMHYARIATTPEPPVTVLEGEQYATLVALWDNDDDAIYDQI